MRAIILTASKCDRCYPIQIILRRTIFAWGKHAQFDPKVFQLGYVALATPDLARAKDHYLETIGLTETEEARGELYLSVGYEHHNIVLHRADKKSLLHLGFQLKPDIDLKDFAQEALNYGVPAEIKSDSQPGINELVEVEVAEGNVLQFYNAITAPSLYHHDPDKVLIDLYTDMDVFIPELGMCEARPWHEHFPMRPKSWKLSVISIAPPIKPRIRG